MANCARFECQDFVRVARQSCARECHLQRDMTQQCGVPLCRIAEVSSRARCCGGHLSERLRELGRGPLQEGRIFSGFYVLLVRVFVPLHQNACFISLLLGCACEEALQRFHCCKCAASALRWTRCGSVFRRFPGTVRRRL